MDTLTSLRVFCTVVEFKSFTAAASRLGLSPAMASKHLTHLEDRLGTRLLNRTSRRVSLTEVGALYVNQARQMLDGLDEVEAAISNVAVTPRGTLKLSAPMWMANALIARAIADYRQRYPDVSVDMDFSGRIVSIVDEGFDLALRATSRDRLDPGLVARPLMEVPFQLVGTPDYLERAGRPSTLSDLNGHSLLLYGGMNANGNLTFKGRSGTEAVKFRVVMRSENEIMLHLAALEGMGLVFLPAWMTQSDVNKGALEVVLPEDVMFSIPLHAVYPSKKYLSAKVRTFIDFFAARVDSGRVCVNS
ncbi:LysR family transcriptional regulator [Bradyrhizobium sp. KB893862 SZCCT0404]|uniref:LysR family transcriptional regulator n=1 Tax=Bradyrhizobium sp. KB893862 SZCCT0404 TaxID=2807672 RepID=UPI001BAC4BAC|nr:LysR family transcriptional regulator [Bradyrhizobium sp. KB893862 SZCCT0404]MBR1175318.1 LysR family transcriptional regulator [Bradyrhizobium sp. KB893862 SZCCT0404]